MALMRPFNLLSYPSAARQRRVFHRWWSSLAGLVMGCSLAWVGQQWQTEETRQLRQVESQLQSSWLARTQETQHATRQQSRQRLQAEQAAHLQKIEQHQQAWMAVHGRLQDMAQERGLRLSRLSSDAGQMALHGAVNRFEVMAAARQSLSDQLGYSVSLTNVTTGPAAQVNFVWQTTWPTLDIAPLDTGLVTGRVKP
jgi:hypothetical protein